MLHIAMCYMRKRQMFVQDKIARIINICPWCVCSFKITKLYSFYFQETGSPEVIFTAWHLLLKLLACTKIL